MQKFFINKIKGNIVSLTKQDEQQLITVLRSKINDQFIAIKDNKKYLCKLCSINPVRSEIVKELVEDTSNNFELNIFQSSIKPNHLEIAIAKACELNVNNFYIFDAYYSQKNIVHNLERYKRIIKESCEQSNRNSLMNIEIVDERNLIKLLDEQNINIIADLIDNNSSDIGTSLNSNFEKIGIVIGPEGGFNENDHKIILRNNYAITRLTKTILRSETAMIYLSSVISYFMLKGKK